MSYPIGRFRARTGLSAEERRALIDDLSALPTDLRTAVSDLSAEQLDTPYRPAGWTVRQVVHHLPDSHMNGYVRFKLAMTEDEPKVRSYNEASWAQLIDARGEDIESSLVLLEMLHRRWVRFLRSLAENQFRRIVLHPERGRLTLEYMLQLYAWHGRHHLAHIERLREWMGW
ncbi:MAG: putative metal-dependent hydrolase [Gemmatimonadetes bacterium]|nr:putative metal-dependent hydrolase [Gemmatimonadota bacterium]